MTMRSVSAGEYAPPPAEAPETIEIWGTTPVRATVSRKMRPYPASAAVPSCMRAPPDSTNPTTGIRALCAVVSTRTIVSAWRSPSEPPRNRPSWA